MEYNFFDDPVSDYMLICNSKSTTSWVGADGRVYHSHDGLAPHSHEPIYSPGYLSRRAPPLINRDFNERAFTVGIGGPVGTGYFLFSF